MVLCLCAFGSVIKSEVRELLRICGCSRNTNVIVYIQKYEKKLHLACLETTKTVVFRPT